MLFSGWDDRKIFCDISEHEITIFQTREKKIEPVHKNGFFEHPKKESHCRLDFEEIAFRCQSHVESSLVIAKGWILVSPFYEHKILEICFPFV